MREFLKLDNRLILKLKIKSLSPLCIKLSCNNTDSLSALLTTEGGISVNEERKKLDSNNSKTKKVSEIYKRDGEIYIPGSTLKGLFRDRFITMYGGINEKGEKLKNRYLKEIFGYTENKKIGDETARKSRFFIQDSFLESEDKRKLFYSNEKEEILDGENEEKIIKTRSITPIDHFSSKAITPLEYEYTMEEFSTELIINNVTKKDLQGIFFIIRDSINGEIRIGNSKTRGFGQIELKVSDLRYDIYYGKEEIFKETFGISKDEIEKFFELDEKNSIKLGENYFCKAMHLKKEYREVKVETPNNFIKNLFSEVKR